MTLTFELKTRVSGKKHHLNVKPLYFISKSIYKGVMDQTSYLITFHLDLTLEIAKQSLLTAHSKWLTFESSYIYFLQVMKEFMTGHVILSHLTLKCGHYLRPSNTVLGHFTNKTHDGEHLCQVLLLKSCH